MIIRAVVFDIGIGSLTELGYDLRSAYWNHGFATEAALAVRGYAFDVLQLPQLFSLIRIGTFASQRVAAKIGMHLAEEFTWNEIRYWKYGLKKN